MVNSRIAARIMSVMVEGEANPVALGIDIGGTIMKAAIVDSNGRIVESSRAATPATLSDFQTALETLIRKLILLHPEVQYAGIGCKGIIDPKTTRVDVLPGTLHYLEGHSLAALACSRVPGLTIAADNDARIAMAGELRWGAARGHDNAILLTLGTGVGGGIVVDGKILRGATGVAGHVGHYTINTDGPICICGNRGCLETYFSARAIESEAFAAVHRGVASSLLNLSKQPPSCADVFTAAIEGDAIAGRIVARATAVLSSAIAGLVLTFDPELIILGGQISAAGDFLFSPVREDVAARTRLLLRREVPIVPSQLEDPSGVIGAAALAFESAPAM